EGKGKESVEQPSQTKVEAAPPQVRREKVYIVETPLYRATFVDAGGGIKGWELKHYKETMEEGSKRVEMLALPPGAGPTLDTRLLNTGLPEGLVFKASTDSLSITSGQKGEMVFTWHSPEGVRIDKRYRFSSDSYTVLVEVSLQNNSPQPINGVTATDLVGPLTPPVGRDGYFHTGPIAYINGRLVRKTPTQGEDVVKDRLDWAGLEDKYFASILIPQDPKDIQLTTGIHSQGAVRARFTKPVTVPPRGKVTTTYKAYIGPKDFDTLKDFGVGLEEAIEFGIFAFLARPSLQVLRFFYSYLHNYGLAIILLTVIIKILFHPLTRHSLTSMKELQRIQPQMMAIRERYKNDKEKMNKELMELYKRYKINPLGGCLPIILQIPVFIALYEALYASIELRHAPLVLWIKDLSAPDPYYVTPILMGGTMLIQQWMTPTTVDPQQARIMLIMPVIFTFLFLTFPSGLVLYWLVNNVLSIAQQYYIQKTVR
ncbi:MAG: membrane protein insertase YidC, partial [Deltaproteobacteria bacterium]|nr:membrane protein insertase YidC [Deltaproteobacteria bacterium]